MKALLIVLILFSANSECATLKLPLGGMLEINEKEWDIQDFKLKGERVLTITNKKYSDLQGFVLGGQIREKGPCAESISGKKWVICQKSSKETNFTNNQILVQRKVSSKSFQNYMLTFNLPAGKEKLYDPLIQSLKKDLESSK